jgi:hypothetical protein
MKKTAKKKKAAPKKAVANKKPANKMLKAKTKPAAKAMAKSAAKPKAKVATKSKPKAKGLSIAELFEMKKQHEEQINTSDPHTHEAPPHEVHDKVNLQEKPKGNNKLARGPGPGNRHH